jgi:alpha-amylase
MGKMFFHAVGIISILLLCSISSGDRGSTKTKDKKYPFIWENASVYFLLTDRFFNADTSNYNSFGRKADGAKLRSFEGGDIKGIIAKIEDGYFDKLGINAIWTTPVFQQVKSWVDEGYGRNYAYHGYWINDWTNLDPNFGSYQDFELLVKTAHKHGIRILMDVVINHTGPLTDLDSLWPEEWVRTSPRCTYRDYSSNVNCVISLNPDIRTESNKAVGLPEFLVKKWKKEGRYDEEINELNAFFSRTGYPRAPRFYIIKWLTDYVRKLGIDGFRVDTAKHTEASVWDELSKEAEYALRDWKKNHSAEKLDDLDFYMVAEVYGYSITNGRQYSYGDSMVDFFNHGFKSLINFGFKDAAGITDEEMFSKYSVALNGVLKDKSVLNYVSSHDDVNPFDLKREKVFEAATRLLLCPGAAQIYYGDELARPLIIPGTTGDATLRSMMNWDDLANNSERNGIKTRDIYDHWCRLGQFRKEHPSVGAGVHMKLADNPYVFKRTLSRLGLNDRVIVIIGKLSSPFDVAGIFSENTVIKDYYSGKTTKIVNGKLFIDTPYNILLLGIPL